MRRPLAWMALAAGLGFTASALAQTSAAPASGASAPSPDVGTPPSPPPAPPAPPAPEPPAAVAPPPAEPAPATAPPPSSPAASEPVASEPTSAPMLSVNTPGEHKKDEGDAKPPPPKDAWQDGHGLGVEGTFRVGGRFGSANVEADREQKVGLGFDLGLWLRVAPEYSFGLTVKRSDLGGFAVTDGPTTLDAGYASTALALGGRAYPFRTDQGEVFVGLRVGMAWQDVDAKGLRPSVNLQPPQNFSCSDIAGPGFALGAEVGGALRLTRALWLATTLGMDGYHLTSERVGDCIAGIGSITTLSFGGGLLYAFDLGRDAKLSALPRRIAF